jgi:DMSO/TMAO reductase YedYZ molybdopterin-dependent catalytic subunit
MQYHSERPLTGSVPAHEHDFDVTPSDRMFVRNNLLTPDINAAQHRLAVKGLVDKELAFTLDELRSAFPVVTLQGMLECAGSGARTSTAPSGTPWSRPAAWAARSGPAFASPTSCARRNEAGAAHVAGQGVDPA